jgi:hypothetical protein
VVTVGECQEAANRFFDANKADFSSICKKDNPTISKPICKQCNSKKDPKDAFTTCSKDKKSTETIICANRFRDMAEINNILRHELQIAKDLCSCKKGCGTVDPTQPDEDFCDGAACLEVRACFAGKCDGKSSEPGPDGEKSEKYRCVWDCAGGNLVDQDKCKGKIRDYLKKAIENCYPKDGKTIHFPL